MKRIASVSADQSSLHFGAHTVAVPWTSEVMSITPAIARQMLANNWENNRYIREERVQKYQQEMLSGTWSITTEGILLDFDGSVLDGQHRLTAVVRLPEGTVIEMTVNRYKAPCPSEVKGRINVGLSRTIADSLTSEGKIRRSDAKIITATAVSIWQGLRRSTASVSKMNIETVFSVYRSDMDWAMEALGRNGSILSPVRAAFAIASVVSPADVQSMATTLNTRVGMKERSPELALSKTVDKGLTGTRDVIGRIDLFDMTLNSLRHKIMGHQLSRLQSTKDGTEIPQSLEWFMMKRRLMGAAYTLFSSDEPAPVGHGG